MITPNGAHGRKSLVADGRLIFSRVMLKVIKYTMHTKDNSVK